MKPWSAGEPNDTWLRHEMTTQLPNDDASTPTWKLAAARPGQMWGWANWQAWEAGHPPLGGVEYTLYTDAGLLLGEPRTGLGPYQLLETGAFPMPLDAVLPSVVLRADHHIYPAVEFDIEAIAPIAAPDAYHGGQVADELASLVSLALGIRLDNGGLTRVFGMKGDPRGLPIEVFNHSYRPRRLNRLDPGLLIPRLDLTPNDASAAQIRLADSIPWLRRYFRLEQGQANALGAC
jgi:hypothetical protein